MNCCVKFLGSIPHTDLLNTGIIAAQGGVHIALLSFAGVKIRRTFTVNIGSEIKIPRPFNEDYLYALQILQPDGTYYQQDGCENFSFKTYVSLDLSFGVSSCDELPYE